MKTKIFKYASIILGFVIIGCLVYGSWLLLNAFTNAIEAASAEVTAAIIGAMATILVGIAAVLLSQAHERKRAADEAHRLKKVEIYQGFIDMISRLMGASNENLQMKGPDEKELVQYLFKFKSGRIQVRSAILIKKWSGVRCGRMHILDRQIEIAHGLHAPHRRRTIPNL